MDASDARRRLFRNGVLLFLVGLVSGLLVPMMTNPRMGLAAHTSGVASGTFLVVLGALWGDLRLAERAKTVAFWLATYGLYAGWAAVQLGAILGTSGMTPIAGAGHTGSPAAEAIVDAGLMSGAAALLTACVLLLWGLRGRLAGERTNAEAR